MSQHVPDDLLMAFVDGDVGEQLAVHIAEHLDACPSCLNRAAGMEPLHAAFAAVPDPPIPDDLVAAVLAEASQPERLPVVELGVGAGLLAAAGMAAVLLGNPIGAAAEFGVVIAALGDVARILTTGLAASSAALTAVIALALAGLFVTARIAAPVDVPGMAGDRRLS